MTFNLYMIAKSLKIIAGWDHKVAGIKTKDSNKKMKVMNVEHKIKKVADCFFDIVKSIFPFTFFHKNSVKPLCIRVKSANSQPKSVK